MTWNEAGMLATGLYVGLVLGFYWNVYLTSRRRAYSFKRDGDKFIVLRTDR